MSEETTETPTGSEITPEMRSLWTRSAVLEAAKRILGPFARVREKAGIYTIWLEKGPVKIPLGSGPDPYGAFYSTFVLPLKAREMGLAPPSLQSQSEGAKTTDDPLSPDPASQYRATDVPPSVLNSHQPAEGVESESAPTAQVPVEAPLVPEE